tara:strand:+ start:688 stop:996 length:309 start_codon:yes stop_codon:yes gene_type:complete
MNAAFTKKRFIELDEKWDITPDSDHGVVLTFKEPRERVKKNTLEVEEFIFVEKYYFPRISQALMKYADASSNDLTSILEVIRNQQRIINLITKIDHEFKQFR